MTMSEISEIGKPGFPSFLQQNFEFLKSWFWNIDKDSIAWHPTEHFYPLSSLHFCSCPSSVSTAAPPRAMMNVWMCSRLVHLDVEDRSEELLAPALLCHKEPARHIQSPLLKCTHGYFSCSSLVLYGTRDRWLPCTEIIYPLIGGPDLGLLECSTLLESRDGTQCQQTDQSGAAPECFVQRRSGRRDWLGWRVWQLWGW